MRLSEHRAMRQIEHARRAAEIAQHGAPLTDSERVQFACQQAAKDAEAWARMHPEPQPQLDLHDAA
jgi:hypothetical protein